MEMDKIQVVILGISATPGGNAFALVLKELDGNRRLPIIIGAFEAQAIAFELEGIVPPRPMTHDLIKIILESLGSQMQEVYIDELEEGTFHAKMVLDGGSIKVDCRPSDAIAIAVRMNVPIFVNSEIIDEAGILAGENEDSEENVNYVKPVDDYPKPTPSTSGNRKLDVLQSQLDKAIKDENYEVAAKLRDEIKKLFESS